MRFKNSPQLPGAGRTRAWHHHGGKTPTSPRAIYVLKSANGGLFYTPLYMISTIHEYFYAFRENTVIKILVICNDEFSMMAVQLIVHFLKEFKILVALAALKDEGLMWYKKNMPR